MSSAIRCRLLAICCVLDGRACFADAQFDGVVLNAVVTLDSGDGAFRLSTRASGDSCSTLVSLFREATASLRVS
jgi:hypothetical protein